MGEALVRAYWPEQKLLPQSICVTKAGVYGNENPGFLMPLKCQQFATTPGFEGF
jgi:hypothetical protein